MESPRLELISWVAAVALTVGGIVTLLVVRNLSTDFGWVATAPLASTSYIPGAYGMTHVLNASGAVVLVLGLVLAGFMAGIRVGRRGRAEH